LVDYPAIGELLKVYLKSVIFKESTIVRRVIIGTVAGLMKALGKQAPPFFAASEVDGAVHGFETSLGEPSLRRVKEQVGYVLVVYAFKEPAASRCLFFLCRCFLVVEGRDTPYGTEIPILHNPSSAFTRFE